MTQLLLNKYLFFFSLSILSVSLSIFPSPSNFLFLSLSPCLTLCLFLTFYLSLSLILCVCVSLSLSLARSLSRPPSLPLACWQAVIKRTAGQTNNKPWPTPYWGGLVLLALSFKLNQAVDRGGAGGGEGGVAIRPSV